MNTKKNIVVGGGIAGIITAYHLMKEGFPAILLERSDKIGGLLASKHINGFYYDHGTHFLAETGIKELDNFLFDGISCEYFQYLKVGSFFGTLFEGNGFIHDFAFPSKERREFIESFVTHKRKLNQSYQNVKDQLHGEYGSLIYSKILEPPLRKFFHTDPCDLAPGSQNLFGLNRIMLGDEEQTKSLKTNPEYDRLLGYHSYTDGLPVNRALYPKNGGVGSWIDLLQTKLEEGGVEIIKNADFDLELEGNLIQQLKVHNDVHRLDKLYWTVPPVMIYDKLKLDKLAPAPRRLSSIVVDIELQGSYKSDVFYVQNFDPSMLSFRVTLYDNFSDGSRDDKRRITVEILDDVIGEDENFYGSKALIELEQMKLVERHSEMSVVGCEIIKGGFPVPTQAFSAATLRNTEGLKAISNLQLFGKATGRAWFMADVIHEIHQHFSDENNI